MIPAKHKVVSLILSPADSSLVFFIGTEGMNWVSEDCGENLKSLSGDRKIMDFKFHPTQREWALSSIYTECEYFDDEECDVHPEVYLTTNLGKNWKKLQDNVIQYEWGKQDKDDKVPEKQILIVKHETTDEEEPTTWSRKNKIILSDDFFKTKRVILKGGNYFKQTKDYLYAGKVTPRGKKVLTRALKKYEYNSFYDMQISKKNLHQFDFTVIESITGAVFLFVTRPNKQSDSGNVYLSDATGTGFSLNLERVPFTNSFEYDFLEIESLEGVIIANTFDPDNMNAQVEDTGKGKYKKVNRNVEADQKRKSYITFNRGGRWEYLNPPVKTSTGKNINCKIEKGCSLHLHSLTSDRYPFPYSVQNAVGIIVGIGNVGKYLQYDDNKLNVYISRDGGLTWFEVIKGPHIVEFGDHGGVILLAPLYKKTDYILYTWNYGVTWEAFKLPEKMQVDNIVIEPRSISSNFIVFGEPHEGKNGVIIAMDFNDLHEARCQGASTPDTKGSDYEYWSPNDGRHGSDCFLGRKVNYLRRKKDSACFNGEEYEPQAFVDNCECTRYDFECDNGYKKLPNADDCVPIGNITEATIPEDCDDFYTVTSGYRKIPGDSCVGGDNYIPLRIMCPKKWGLFSVRTLLVLCVFLLTGYFTAKFLNEHGFPTFEDIKGIFVKPKKTKKGDDEYEYNAYDIGYNDSDSDGETKERQEPTLELEQENDYDDFMEGISLRTKK